MSCRQRKIWLLWKRQQLVGLCLVWPGVAFALSCRGLRVWGWSRNGIEMLPRRDELVTLNHVQSILDEEGI